MTAILLAPPAEIIHLTGISWKTYEALLAESIDSYASRTTVAT